MTRRNFIEEQFKEFLKRHNTSFDIYINYNNHRTNAFSSYEDIIEKADYISLISDAFKWADTTERHYFWSKLSGEWFDIVGNYLLRDIPYYIYINKNLYND